MARGNWQRRVERTEARRAAAKNRKQKKGNRAAYKGMVASLMTTLDKHRVSSSPSTATLHIWTDAEPSDFSPPILDMYADGDDAPSGKHKQRRGRSGSFNDTPSKKNDLGGYASNKKKSHPRSRDSIEPVEEEGPSVDAPRLCRNQFYQGKCGNMMKQGSKKNAGGLCRHVHYIKKEQKTLSDVLDSKNQEDVLEVSETAMVESTIDDVEDSSEGMEMLYYFTVTASDVKDDAEEESLSIGQLLSQKLSEKSCINASLVYITVEDTLIFDRYQGGLVLEDLSFLFGDGRRPRSTSIMSETSEAKTDDGNATEYAESVPAPVLEHILSFLPDTAVAAMTRVCSSWQNEIGTTSPALWRYLLQRRNWPLPSGSRTSSFTTTAIPEEITTGEMKDCFTGHYQVVRDVTAIKDALAALVIPRRAPPDEVEMVYQLFSTRRKTPVEPNACVAMEVWSPDKTIAAYSHDCTIRLFKAVEKSSAEKGDRACRELISVCVDPYRKTKKHTARLVAMGLDDDKIGCLLHVHGGVRTENYILSIISRDDYLEAAGSDTADSLGWSELDEGALKVIDIGEAVVNYLLSVDEADHRMLRLIDFLADGEEMEDIEVLVSDSVVACGHGRFLVEVTISIPDLDTNENEDNDIFDAMITLDRKMVIFSSTVGAIVWMGDSNPTQSSVPRNRDLMLMGVRQRIGGSRLTCNVVAVSSSSPTIILSEIDSTGQLQGIRAIEAAEIVRSEILSIGQGDNDADWVLEAERRRPVALLQTEVVAVDVLSKDRGDDSRDYKSVLSFYPRFSGDDDFSYETIVLNHCNVLSMKQIRNEHVILICEEIGQDGNNPTAATNGGDALLDAVDGQWFGEEPTERVVSLNAVIFHVPSRQVIHRANRLLPNDANLHEALLQGTTSLIFTASLGNTIGVGVWWKGVIMTGSNVRSVGNGVVGATDELMTPTKGGGGRTRKKKKNSKRPTRSKKDGFARGMSMRG